MNATAEAGFDPLAYKAEIEARGPFEDQITARTLYEQLTETTNARGDAPAISFQLTSDISDKGETLSWRELKERATRAANLFRSLGVEEGDSVAYILPNCNEAVVTLLGGATAGIVNPVNPLIEPEKIASILRESGAKVVVTLKPFPKTDLSEKVAEAVGYAPNVKHVVEVDLLRYLTGVKKMIVPFLRPKRNHSHNAKIHNFEKELAKHSGDKLTFTESRENRACGYFHTGGTTGMPKLAQHNALGMLYNGWVVSELNVLAPGSVLMCPLPMFHVFAAYPVFMSSLVTGGHLVMPTPQGYRGDGVMQNFWKLIEKYKADFLITVPTAAAALMQQPINADVSSLKYAISGSAPLPRELFTRFEDKTGLRILEGYGMTEATCLISVNPVQGERKIGSVGIPFPHTEVRILHCDASGAVTKECGVDEIGEICAANPGVWTGKTYTDATKNEKLFADGKYLRTGDLGRIDADGFLWITGRAKDLIIRGGHNIDPAIIEEGLMSHPEVAFVGAIGQPDAHSGEVPAAYVELNDGADVSVGDLVAHCKDHISERAAVPKHIEILPELPKTAVGKVFKPDLRRLAIKRVFDAALKEGGVNAEIGEIREDKKRGLVAKVERADGVSDDKIQEILGVFSVPWEA
ncbi:acyl-CoA synthetase [Paracoccaceae bacterium GXU_MW_L88]